MIEFRAPLIGDISALNPVAAYKGEPWDQKVLRAELSQMWTMCHDGKPLAIVGFNWIWDGVVKVWAVVGEGLEDHGVAATLALRRFLQSGAKASNVHRMEMTVKFTYDEGKQWAEALGFKFESILFRYGTDRAHYELWVRQF